MHARTKKALIATFVLLVVAGAGVGIYFYIDAKKARERAEAAAKRAEEEEEARRKDLEAARVKEAEAAGSDENTRNADADDVKNKQKALDDATKNAEKARQLLEQRKAEEAAAKAGAIQTPNPGPKTPLSELAITSFIFFGGTGMALMKFWPSFFDGVWGIPPQHNSDNLDDPDSD